MAKKVDFVTALHTMQSRQTITSRYVAGALVRQSTEASLEWKLESHLDDVVAGNRNNRKSRYLPR